MPSACTKRPRNDDDPHLSPDDNDLPSPPKRSRAQWTKDKKYESGKGVNNDEDDETSTEPTSSSGSDSSVDSSDEDDEDSDNEEQEKEKGTDGKEEETVPSLSARQKPRIHRIERNNDILSRITAFLPQMKNANESLQRELAAGRAKEVQLDHDEGGEGEGEGEDEESKGRYIEMVWYIPWKISLWVRDRRPMLTFPSQLLEPRPGCA